MKLVNVKTGADYALTAKENVPRNALPKRFESVAKVVVDGVEVEAPVTGNKGWAGDGPVLTYPWFIVGEKAYYVTLGPGEVLDGEFRIEDGSATRKNPKRVTTKTETEAGRIEAFRKTWAERTAPKVDAKPLEEAMAPKPPKKVKAKA